MSSCLNPYDQQHAHYKDFTKDIYQERDIYIFVHLYTTYIYIYIYISDYADPPRETSKHNDQDYQCLCKFQKGTRL
jgi:hypothetical protein